MMKHLQLLPTNMMWDQGGTQQVSPCTKSCAHTHLNVLVHILLVEDILWQGREQTETCIMHAASHAHVFQQKAKPPLKRTCKTL